MARRLQIFLLLGIVGLSLVPRIPFLYSSVFEFTADEAVNGLTLKQVLAGNGLRAHAWEVTYYGLAEALLALPFVALLGWTPLALKLGSMATFVGLLVAVFLLARRLYGEGAAVAAAALLMVFSGQLVHWSTLAAGGYVLVVTWGVLAFLALIELRPESPGRWLALGVLCGFGLYIYQLFVVFLATILLWLGAKLVIEWRRSHRERLERRALAVAAAALLGGLLLGALPMLMPLLADGIGSRAPAYGLATADSVGRNIRLLLDHCAPALFGVNTSGLAQSNRYLGPAMPRMLPWLVPLAYGGAWLWRFARVARRCRRRGELTVEAALLLLVPVNLALFCLSRNATDILSNHYLLPCVASLPLLLAGALVKLARRGAIAAAASAALGTAVAVIPTLQLISWFVAFGYLTPELRLRRIADPVQAVAALLERHGVRGVYSDYWVSYKLAFLSSERVIAAPLIGWNRSTDYSEFLTTLDRVSYVMPEAEREAFRSQFGSRCTPLPPEIRIGRYRVLLDVAKPRPQPRSPAEPAVVSLQRPMARVEILDLPAAAAPGARLALHVRLTNLSDGAWSSAGEQYPPANLATRVVYRWLDDAGTPVTTTAERALLPQPVLAGETIVADLCADTPARPGTFDLYVTLLQENVAWFDQTPGNADRKRIVLQPAPEAPTASNRDR